MENLARLDHNDGKIDLQEYQKRIIAAEESLLSSFEKMTSAAGAYAGFIREMGYSVSDPYLKGILTEGPSQLGALSEAILFLDKCHRDAYRCLLKRSEGEFTIDARFPKDELG